MRTLVRFLALAVAAAALLAITQRRQINAARTELAPAEPGALVQPATSSSPPPPISGVTPGDLAHLRAATRDIHKLRGQITQARQQRREFERLQMENTRLRKKIDQFKANPHAAPAEPFPLADKGQATPDAALETTFWAMSQGDLEALSRLMPMLADEFQRMPPEERNNSISLLRVMGASISQFEIVNQTFESPNEARVDIKITRREGMALGANHSTFILRRTNDLWQIVGER